MLDQTILAPLRSTAQGLSRDHQRRSPPPLHSGAPQGPFPHPLPGPLISDPDGPLTPVLSVVQVPTVAITELCDH